MKNIAILGSTGSIGEQAVEVIRQQPDLRISAIGGAGHRLNRLEEQAREFRPELVAVWSEKGAHDLKTRLADTDVRVASGMEGMLELASMPASDLLLTAVVGMIGIRPTLAAIEAGKEIALANKETLVTAGHLIMPLAKKKGVRILPVDSEHSAIFQCLQGSREKEIHKLYITASGGPFRGYTREQLENVTKEDALRHPNWSMGNKITIDSATMVNKGLEVMEARWLFHTAPGQIEVLIQPDSIIHSMVEFADGAVLAQLGTPDMRLPIQYALCYPERRYRTAERLDFRKISSIRLETPDMEVLRGLPLALEAQKAGGSMPTVFNAANEEAVALFLHDQIRFLDIYRIIEDEMAAHKAIPTPSLDEILAVEADVRREIRGRW